MASTSLSEVKDQTERALVAYESITNYMQMELEEQAHTPARSDQISQQVARPFPSLARATHSSSGPRSHINKLYHDALIKYKRLRNAMEQGSDDIVMEGVEIPQSRLELELMFLADLRTTANEFNLDKEVDTWMLLERLREVDDIDFVLKESSTKTLSPSSKRVVTNTLILQPVAELTAVDAVNQSIIQSDVRRRQILRSWLEDSYRCEVTYRPLDSSRRSGLNAVSLPDAPAKNKSVELHTLQSLFQALRSNNSALMEKICKDVGESWRWITMNSGKPWGYSFGEDDVVFQTGNPNFFLWRRTCAELSKQDLAKAKEERDSEVAEALCFESLIYSILSNDIQTTLKNPLLKFPEKLLPQKAEYDLHQTLLYFFIRGLDERNLDKTIKLFTDECRKGQEAFPYPGTREALKPFETQQLNESSLLDNITEDSIYDDKMGSLCSDDVLINVQRGIICSVDSLIELMQSLAADDTEVIIEEELLRFAVHFCIYLHEIMKSHAVGGMVDEYLHSRSSVTEQRVAHVEAIMCKLIKRFIQYLLDVSEFDLIPLYAAFLSDDGEELAHVLLQISENSSRKDVMRLLPEQFSDTLSIVNRSMEICFYEREIDQVKSEGLVSYNGVELKESDLLKVLHLQYYSCLDDPTFWSVAFTNALLRKLIIEYFESNQKESLVAANLLINELDPSTNGASVMNDIASSRSDNNNNRTKIFIEQSEDEHDALQCYLIAHKSYEKAISLLQCSPKLSIPSNFTQVQKNAMLATFISKINENLIEIVRATSEAETALEDVLLFEEGWLQEVGDSDYVKGDELVETSNNSTSSIIAFKQYNSKVSEGTEILHQINRSQVERAKLRKYCIPEVIELLHTVFVSAAEWAVDLLIKLSGKQYYENKSSERLRDDLTSFIREWYSKAVQVSHHVADFNELGIADLIDEETLSKFVEMFNEDAVNLMQYTKGENGYESLTI